MRKHRRFIAIAMCVSSIMCTACGGSNKVNKTSDEDKTTTREIETTTAMDGTLSENETKVDITTAAKENGDKISSNPETSTEVETTTPETTTKEETTTVRETTKIKETTTVEETTTSLTVTSLDKTMYVKSSVNVRSGPSTDFDKIGSLSKGKSVKVTGKSDQTGWYRIDYNGKVGYVSDSYLQAEPLPEEQTTTKSQVQSSSLEKLINSQTLNPFRSDFTPAYEEIDKVFASIFKDGMTTYDKVKACYDYLIKNCSYGQNQAMDEYLYYYFYGYSYEVRTYGILKGKIGVCDDYSAAFATMMQAIGLNCYVVGGQTAKSGGGYTGHAWCEMNLNGTIYVFDPQVEDNIAKGGAIKYYRFGKTYDQVPGKYIKE